jgi:hypothetical protein
MGGLNFLISTLGGSFGGGGGGGFFSVCAFRTPVINSTVINEMIFFIIQF